MLTIVIRRTLSDSIDSGARDRDTRHAGIQARPETERSSTQQSDSIRLNRSSTQQSDSIRLNRTQSDSIGRNPLPLSAQGQRGRLRGRPARVAWEAAVTPTTATTVMTRAPLARAKNRAGSPSVLGQDRQPPDRRRGEQAGGLRGGSMTARGETAACSHPRRNTFTVRAVSGNTG